MSDVNLTQEGCFPSSLVNPDLQSDVTSFFCSQRNRELSSQLARVHLKSDMLARTQSPLTSLPPSAQSIVSVTNTLASTSVQFPTQKLPLAPFSVRNILTASQTTQLRGWKTTLFNGSQVAVAELQEAAVGRLVSNVASMQVSTKCENPVGQEILSLLPPSHPDTFFPPEPFPSPLAQRKGK